MILIKKIMLAAVLSTAWFSAHAQSTIDIYQQDFENPVRPLSACTGFGGNADTANAATSYTSGTVPYYQIRTADRLCVSKTGWADDIIDPAPALIADDYAIGFHGSSDAVGNIESIGFIFDPQSYQFLNGTFNASLMGIPTYASTNYGFDPGVAVNFTLQFYEIPAGTANTSVAITGPTALGGNAGVNISGSPQTAFATEVMSVSNSNTVANRFTLDWHDYSFSIDLSAMTATNSRVMMVMTGLPNHHYLALDNFDIKATLNNITLPTGLITVQPGTTGTFDPLNGASNSLNLPLTVQPNPTSSDPAAGTVTVDPATGVISFTPVTGFTGDVVVTFEVCDNQTAPNQVCTTSTVTFRVPTGSSASAGSPVAVPVNAPWALGLLSVVIGLAGSGLRRRSRHH
ncbi:Ig-like domain-containing protein [Ottowia sp.]|uniref:Ig-like domain-containing protein n=1 Tax=Ottowia sp. TaxID=1898956 RepID=UPI003A84A99C